MSSSSPANPNPNPTLNGSSTKRKRRPAGTPDPDAEVVFLSSKMLLESDQYVCEICNQGFQRDQNLQMHRRRHKVPWRLLKRDDADAPQPRKRVFVCPEPSCLHHDPCHALGDLVGIKKHFRRKHCDRRQWVCGKCCKRYAVQSDYKAHVKTCGTRGHSCDCGRVFSRVESFIEHQDACTTMRHLRSPPPCLSVNPIFTGGRNFTSSTPDLELQLSIGLSELGERKTEADDGGEIRQASARERLRVAVAEKKRADEVRQRARRQVEEAERELAEVKRFRQAAQVELERAEVMKEHAARKMSSTVMQLSCHGCRKQKLLGLQLQC